LKETQTMANETRDLATAIGGRRARRRAIFRTVAVAGVLAVTVVPTITFGENDKDNPGRHLAKGRQKGGRIEKGGRIGVGGKTGGGSPFGGQIQILNFQGIRGTGGAANQLRAQGTLSGDFADLTGRVIATLDRAPFTVQVNDINASAVSAQADVVIAQTTITPPTGCTILHLVLGPLQLNLLGLVLTITEQVTVDLTAVPGGGLLGDLLCAIDQLLGPLNTPTPTVLPGTPSATVLPGTPSATVLPGTPSATVLPGTPTATVTAGTPVVPVARSRTATTTGGFSGALDKNLDQLVSSLNQLFARLGNT
jgi:hypothetical protein